MSAPFEILRVAVPTPLRRSFDYLPPTNTTLTDCRPGCRVEVSFGRQKLVGVILERTRSTEQPGHKLKHVLSLLDDAPVLDADLLELLRFASAYYQHPVGEVVSAALPALLRQGKSANAEPAIYWQLTPQGQQVARTPRRAIKQAALLSALHTAAGPLSDAMLKARVVGANPVLQRLHDLGWIEKVTVAPDSTPSSASPTAGPALSDEQAAAVQAIQAALDQFGVFVLEGVTGSGKTEVYLQLIAQQLLLGKQVLVLVPEIGLTPQLLQRFEHRLGSAVALWHSALTDSERLQTWRSARDGTAKVIIGTRSAIFLPVQDLGLLIIDEEHDASFKQQEGFRYSARDLAILRARARQIPILMGSATPSLETLANIGRDRYTRLVLQHRAGGAKPPHFHILDMRRQPLDHGLSMPLTQRMREHLQANGQVLLFLNRRGFAPTLLCHDCGWIATCSRCDAHLTLHHSDNQLRCHHCGTQRRKDPVCPVCKSEQLIDVGVGTERIEASLHKAFADYEIVRIDRDTTRRKGSLDALLEKVRNGERQILIGTQMLAKGHHFPNVTLVGILDTDQGLHSADFRATERMAQQIIQVSGRAGRAERPGEVMIQTHHPEHPLLHTLVEQGYDAFAQAALGERQLAELPPYAHMAIIRAEATRPTAALAFLQDVAKLLVKFAPSTLQHFGPFPAPMEKRAGKVRAQLILLSTARTTLQKSLQQLLAKIETELPSRSVRWSVDVDPLDTY